MPTPSEYLNHISVIIITGGSSGIGRSTIKAILKVRSDIVLCNLSRSKPDFFLGEHGIHLPTDLSNGASLQAAAGELQAVIDAAPAGGILLMNNSGFGDYGRLQDLDVDKQLKMIDLNITAMVELTARLLPSLLKRGGTVVNVASTAGFQPTPFLATYGATKAFVLNWTLALNEDLRGTRVRTLAVCPGPTRSNFFKAAGFDVPPIREGANGLDMTSEEVADRILIALARGKSMVVTGWKNNVIAAFGSKFPIVAVTRIGGIILRKMRLETHKGLKK
jgi:short-subunit dehydrogenase